MLRTFLPVLWVSWISAALVAHAQDTAAAAAPAGEASVSISASASTDVPPPPPAETDAAVPTPPAAYTGGNDTASTRVGDPTATALPDLPPRAPNANARRYWNIWLGLGFGDAVGCGNEDPNSPCAVEGAAAFTLAADYRFVPNFSVGLELSAWAFSVSDQWLGQLDGEPKSAEMGAAYFAVFGRWYWFDEGIVDPYVQLGIGLGGLTATVSNEAGDKYTYSASGVVSHLGIGVDFHVHPAIRLGPQLQTALLLGNEVCTKLNDEDEECREPEKNEDGEQEGNALAWRFMFVGTVMLGSR